MVPRILVIDDEKSIREVFSVLLGDHGFQVAVAENGRQGIEKAHLFEPDVVLLDMNLPDIPGLEVLAGLRELKPGPEIIIITAFGTIRNAVEATKLGAYAYLEKPIDNDELLLNVSRILEIRNLRRQVETLRSELTSRYRFSNIVGTSGRMNSVFQLMEKMSRVDGTVLVSGESGTGKELVARAIHFASPRKDGPFVIVNCGAVPRDLIESEFFGHVKGAFTDARSDKTGKFELANTGTIFLDEVGELSQDAQVKLLRALGEREIVRVGGTKTVPVDVRVVAATNKDLEAEVASGNFREDLYFRLAVLSLRLPPLRERTEDIPLLVEHFVRKYARELDKNVLAFAPGALTRLAGYGWPGNVRELENIIYEAMVMAEGEWVTEAALPARLRLTAAVQEAGRPPGPQGPGPSGSLREEVQCVAERREKELILEALRQAGGSRTRAARGLGVSRKTLFNKMTSLEIRWPE
ncbi:MAG: sigma-54 dependent transcriptional regulator [Candidatus Aminicenantes bacterium]|nr:sigma-54-dependent Fis family transcriptional regulator [Candidatus Aminicenantes bacterium]MCJ7487200.1 sigma-54 dependent transcriptional regulator [Candidatus Aminicenantes bacterium]TFG57800.1 MAG: sigma-54-dependent Fis family transcriptional regulator [Candidatus Aminicenantes bacterium]